MSERAYWGAYEPYPFQREVWEQTRDLEAYGLFWEMGAGKTLASIMTAAWLYERGEIDALVVLAPKGVYRNWELVELPKHMPEWLPWKAHSWISKNPMPKKDQRSFDAALKFDGLAVFAMNYEATITTLGGPALKRFLTERRCLLVCDESARLKTPGSKTSMRVVAAAKYARYCRILTGTPISQGPFDVYAQLRVLDPDFWKERGMKTFGIFKNRYALFEKRTNASGGQWNQLLRYRNLPELQELVAEVTDRKLKSEVLPDLPPKIYSRHEFMLHPDQRRLYDELRSELRAVLASGEEVSADFTLTKLTRLQQIACGFTGTDDEVEVPIGENVRLDALLELLEDVQGKAIIFARWTWEVDRICEALGDTCVRFDGKVDDEQRQHAIRAFQDSDDGPRWFVGKVSVAGEGITLTRAGTVIYASNSYRLDQRLQSEDRAHRAGMPSRAVHYIDLVATGTYDGPILSALRSKRDVGAEVTGDDLPDWI